MTHQVLIHPPTALFIATDKEFFNKKSSVVKRHQLLAKNFGHVHIVVTNSGIRKNFFSLGNIHIYPTNSRNRWFYVLDALTIASNIANKHTIDIISADNPFISGLIGVMIKLITGAKLNIQVHNDFFSHSWWVRESKQNAIFLLLAKYLLPKADSIRTVSPTISRSLKFVGKKSLIKDIPVFPYISSNKKAINKKTYDIVAVGRLELQKNIDCLLQAVAIVVKKHKEINVAIVGDGTQKKYLKALAKKLAISQHITFFGNLDQPRTIHIVSQSKIYVSSSRYEGLSIALMEAMLLSVPIVASKVSGNLDVIKHNKEGLLFRVGDFKTLAQQLSQLLENTANRRQLAQQAFKKINKIVAADPVEQWADFLIETAMNSRRAEVMKQDNIRHYNTGFKEIEKSYQHPSKLTYNPVIQNWLVKHLPHRAVVVDVGGGAGFIWSQVVKNRPDLILVGTDISLLMTQLRKKIGLHRNFVGDMDCLPIKNASFNCVVFIASLHHTPNTDWALTEAQRILKPKGLLLMAELNSFRFWLIPWNVKAVPSPLDKRECLISHTLVTKEAKKAGFGVDDVELFSQLNTLLGLFKIHAPLWVYRINFRIDQILKKLPLYKELGSLALIKTHKK